MFAVPASFFPYLSTSLHWCPKPGRKEGHAVREPSLLRGIAVLRRSGSRKKRRPPVAARSGGAGAMEEQVGRKARCRAPGTEEGWLPSERERRSRRRSPVGRSLLPSARLVEEQGTGDSLPAALDRRSHRHPPGGGGASGPSTKEVQYHRMAPRVSRSVGWGPSGSVSGNRTEILFFSSLSSLSLLILPSPFLSASSVLTPRYAAAALTGSPRERGEGGSRAQSREYPPGLRGAMGVCDEWGGAESLWERSEAGGVIGNERHLHHSPVSSPTEELRKG